MSISFELLDANNKEWNNVANQISQVSWRAGKSLSEKMHSNYFTDWERVIVGRNNEGKLTSFCVVSKKDGLTDNTISPFIAYVFVSEEYHGYRLSEELLNIAVNYLKEQQFKVAFIVSGEIGLYEKYGYKKLKNRTTIHGDIENLFEKHLK
ncbi:GNAT family N-acetyltransferase [Vagococcus fluvialis]|uniref:GNAT family N-acetyltransferase n=1 Tax=Vagococcus fluvialis TaxID=2738 RepID=UPI003BEF95DB